MYEWFEPYKVVTDQSGVLLFCSNQTELVDYSSICWTKQNRTYLKMCMELQLIYCNP